MDLYVQIGVLYAMLTAFALFLYVYNQPIETVRGDLGQANADVKSSLDDLKSAEVKSLHNNPNVAGTKVETVIKNAVANELAVFLITKEQRSHVVNYGYKLRHENDKAQNLMRYGLIPDSDDQSFSKHFVPVTSLLFGDAYTVTTEVAFNVGGGGLANGDNPASQMNSALLNNNSIFNRVAWGSSRANIGVTGPRILFSDPLMKIGEAVENGRTFFNTGYLFTDQELRKNEEPNENYSYLDNPSSVFYLDRNSSYYTALIRNVNGIIVGVYIEEHGAAGTSNVLGRAMVKAGIISAVY